MRRIVFGLIGLVALADGACAQPGWEPAQLKDFIGTPDYKYRSTQTPFLAANGDFDGDGHVDRARLLRNEQEKKYALEVILSNGKSQHLVEGDLGDLQKLALTLITPGLYGTSCVKGKAAGACASADIDVKHDALSLFEFNGQNRYFYWTGGRFEAAYIVD